MTEAGNPQRNAGPDDEHLYPAEPRGIGLDRTHGCIICGGEDRLVNNCAFFVPSREIGAAIVALFKQGARLDYRPSEPQWIQVKIGACDAHLSYLERFVLDVESTRGRPGGPGICADMLLPFDHLPQPPRSKR